jgi:hypothetical protein
MHRTLGYGETGVRGTQNIELGLSPGRGWIFPIGRNHPRGWRGAASDLPVAARLAYQSCWFADGRRAIVDIFTPGNLVGLETVLSVPASGDIAATGMVKYLALDSASVH